MPYIWIHVTTLFDQQNLAGNSGTQELQQKCLKTSVTVKCLFSDMLTLISGINSHLYHGRGHESVVTKNQKNLFFFNCCLSSAVCF